MGDDEVRVDRATTRRGCRIGVVTHRVILWPKPCPTKLQMVVVDMREAEMGSAGQGHHHTGNHKSNALGVGKLVPKDDAETLMLFDRRVLDTDTTKRAGGAGHHSRR